MICKGTAINRQQCIHCKNVESQKKVIDTFFEDHDVVIVFKCLACNGLIKANYKPYVHRPFNGTGFKIEEHKEVDEKDLEPKAWYGIYDSVGEQSTFRFKK